MPKRAYTSREDKAMPDFKVVKDPLNYLLRENASGNFKLKF